MENIAGTLNITSIIIAFLAVLFFGIVIFQKIKKKRKKEITSRKIYDYLLGFLVLAPVMASLYFIPIAFYDVDFWSKNSQQFIDGQNAMKLLGASIIAFYTLVRIAIFLPHNNQYYNIGSQLLLLSLFPGIASAINVMIISKFITEDIPATYLLFFFAVTTFIYVVTIRISKRKTVSLGILTAHKFNMLITNKAFKIPYRKYEQVRSGKIYTLLNDDIRSIFVFSQDVINTYTNLITILMVLVYLFTVSWVSTLMLFVVTGLILGILVLMSPKIKKAGHKSRLKRERYTNLISGLINGFKELVLHRVKRDRFQKDLENASQESYDASRENINIGIDAGLFSELSFTIAVGVSCLLFPLIFEFEKDLITAYVIAVLFLWGPVGTLINGVPRILDVQVSWKRIKQFIENAEIDELVDEELPENITVPIVENISVQDVYFTYKNDNLEEDITYGIGPIDFEANLGELVFIVGGNGSGKTTLLKLLVGLYQPNSGRIQINGRDVSSNELSECFSVIYSDFYLFKKIYDIKQYRLDQVYEWLELLQLSDKVSIEDGAFSTVDLSKGQRKRLAILKSYLEDRPVYFFDEVAADLDPGFRSFFYNNLLMKMKSEGKILIIISHDDKYFDLADHIYKMEMGKIEHLHKESFVLSEQY